MTLNPLALQLTDFDLHLDNGFLPDPDPITILPESHVFSPLEKIAHQLPTLLSDKTFHKNFQKACRKLEYVGANARDYLHYYTHCQDKSVLQRLKLIFDYLGQAYVWGQYPPLSRIPAGFAQFWYDISQKLDMPPILSYSSYVLHNWHRINPHGPIALGNIAVNQHFLGDTDENWFILIHVDIEERAHAIPIAIIKILQAITRQDVHLVETYISMIFYALKAMLKTLERMPEHCDEHIYYTRVRPYLHGWKNNPSLPQGIVYQGVSSYGEQPQQFRGESGAQSSIVPSLVAILDIHHTETAFTPYLKEIRAYMPPGHRKFIEKIEHLSFNGYSLLDFVTKRKTSHPSLYDVYRTCRQALYDFRKKHYEYVGRYIHSQAQQHDANPTAIGTAGTPFMQSLKQLMDETWFV